MKRPGLNPTNKEIQKKFRKISGFLTKFLDFGYCDPTKNSWILFSKIWPAICTKKLDPIFFRFIQKKIEGSKFSDLSEKKIGSEIFLW